MEVFFFFFSIVDVFTRSSPATSGVWMCFALPEQGREAGSAKGSHGEIPVDPRELNYGPIREGVFVRLSFSLVSEETRANSGFRAI